MIVKIRVPRLLFPRFHQPATALAAGPMLGASFHAALSDCADDWVVQHRSPRAYASSPRSSAKRSQQPGPGTLARAWSWLNSKYALTATKRLRVAETVSLGEKRFVALVCVEGREFLVGGGASGVSLLAQLTTGRESGNKLQSALDGEEDSE